MEGSVAEKALSKGEVLDVRFNRWEESDLGEEKRKATPNGVVGLRLKIY